MVFLIAVIIIFNCLAISSYKKKNTSFLWSGLLICIMSPIIGLLTGSIFVNNGHSAGGSGEGGAIGAAFIGLILLGNGIIYLLVGTVLMISNLFKE
ncbi:MAG: ABC transporter permease [Heyndrickxia sp.]